MMVAVSGRRLTLVSWTVLLFLRVWLFTNDLASLHKSCPNPASVGPTWLLGLYLKSSNLSILKIGVKVKTGKVRARE